MLIKYIAKSVGFEGGKVSLGWKIPGHLAFSIYKTLVGVKVV